MIDSKINPQPGEGGGINTINQNGTGLQKEEPNATIPDRDPCFECLKEDQVQAEVTPTLFTFAEACAQPGAKRFIFHGSDGPVNAVEVDGTFFIQNDEAEAKATRSKALELAFEVAVASTAAANPAAAAEAVAAAPKPMPEPAAAHRISYAAAASKSLVGPKPSAAGFEPLPIPAAELSAGLKCSNPGSKPAMVPAPLEVVDDFARAQSTPLPECITGVEGDKDGEFCARYDKFNVTVPIPKIFHHMSFEAEEVAKELTKKIKAEEDAKEMAKKSAASKRATVATTKKKKPANDTKTTEQTTAPAPAKMKDAPATHCATGFRALMLIGLVGIASLFYQSEQPSAALAVTPSFSNDATVLTTKTVSSWSNALDQLGLFNTAPNDDQCGLLDVDAPANNNQCALKEPIVASPEGFKLCVQKLCFASPLQWLPLMLGVPARSSDQVAYDGADTDDTPLSPSPQTPSPSMPRSPISPSPPSSSMLTEDGGADNDEYETVLGCARSVMEHSTGMIEHGEIESYLEGTYLEGKQLFDTFDTDGDGYLVKGEALVRGGEEKEWRHSLEEYDVDRDGQLGYDEFLALLAGRSESEVEEQVTLNVYNTTSMVPTDARNNYEWTADGYYYETHAYQKHLAQRSDQIRAAAASSALDTMSPMSARRAPLAARRDHLGVIFASADTNNDGKVSLAEYTSAGKSSRFEVVQGGFKEAMDRDGDGVVSESESLGAAAFEFGVIDGDRDGIVSAFELENTFEDKGWLRTKDWNVAQALATDGSLPHLVTAYIETHWGDAPEEDYASEQACAAHAADDTSESDELLEGHMNVSASTRRLARKRIDEADKALMTAALQGGYKTLAKIMATDFCWIKAYDRGPGIPAGCKPGWEQRGAMCYRICPSGGKRHWYDLEYCNYPCPSGSSNTGGLTCRTNGWTRGKSCCGTCWPGNWCCRTACCGGCPAGYTNTGCFCEPSTFWRRRDYSPGKTKYDNSVVGCSNPRYPDKKWTPLGYFCYPAPKPGYRCQLTTCQRMCPHWMVQCGPAACSSSAHTCGAHVGQMIVDVTLAMVQTAAMIASFGTSGAGASQVLNAQTRAAFKRAAKSTIAGFKKRMAQKGVKEATKEAIKKAVKKYAEDHLQGTLTEAHAVNQASLAVGAIYKQIEGQNEQDMEKFDFTVYDPTGIASAVSTTLDDGKNDIDKAAAWTLAVGTFDPTGWLTAAAAFMKGSCDKRTPPSPPPAPPPLTTGVNSWDGCGAGGCSLCEGDCDRDSDCKAGLRCFHRNYLWSVPGCSGDGVSHMDYCIPSVG